MVVPFAAGGPLDIVARHIAEAMSRTLEKNVLVENIGGAGGTLGAARVAKAKPDGYTLLMYHIGLATSPALYKGRLGFNPIDDFRPIGLVNEVAMALVVRPDLGIDSLPSFVQRLATEPETIKIGHAGIGSASHLCTLLIGVATKNDRLIAVSYRGTGPAMTDLLGGHIDVICDLITSSSSVIASKRVNVLAVTTSARLPSLPSVPTVAEVGLGKLEMTNWNALLVPANTPDAIAEKLSAALRSALEDPKVIENLSKLGTAPVRQEDATPDALKQRIAAEIARWSPIIEGAGASGQP
jgi:tripartite-type tricarboxylate transporter receptor subunit TctC